MRLPRLLACVVMGTVLMAADAYGQLPAASTPPPTQADRDAAQREFAEGQRAFRAGDFRHAAEAFEKAYRAAPHHSPLWNAARAWHRAGEPARSANFYAKFLREAPAHAPDRNSANAALEKLSPRLSRLDIHVGDGLSDVRVDGEPALDSVVYVTPGTHSVEATASTGHVTQSVKAEAGGVVSVALTAPEAPPPPPPKVSASQAPPPPATSSGWPPTVVFIGGAVTTVLMGATIWSGLNTWSQKDTFDSSPTQTNLDEGHSRQRRTNILLGLTVGAGVLTGVAAVWLVDWKKPSDAPAPVSVQAGVGPGSVVVRGRF